MTTLAIGDTVRIRPGSYRSEWGGEIVATGPGIYTHTVGFSDETQHTYKANELELIDAESGEVDGTGSDAMSAGVAGSPDDDVSGTGSEAEPAAEEPPVATPESLEAQVASLTARVNRLLAAGTLQGFFNDRHAASIDRNDGHLRRLALRLMTMDELPSPQFNHITTRRMRINITRNTKGYNHDVTFEVTSSDPTLDLQLEMERGLRDADRFARAAIDDAIYTDEHGPPGAEVDDKPF